MTWIKGRLLNHCGISEDIQPGPATPQLALGTSQLTNHPGTDGLRRAVPRCSHTEPTSHRNPRG